MTPELTLAQLRRARLRQQLLAADRRADCAAAVVQRLCALQSQEWASAQLAIAARTSGINAADVRRAREVERSFVLTWSLRGTLHLVAAEDLASQLALFGARAIRASKRRYQQLGLSESIREKSLDHIAEILTTAGPLNRAELAEKLDARGMPVAGQAIHHLVRHAALRGLVCFGPERAGDLTYTLLSHWRPDCQPPDSLGTEAALRHFARRYLRAYGPASSADFARWAGISATRAKIAFAALDGDSVACEAPVGALTRLKRQKLPAASESAPPQARFLPRYDNYLLAYQSRDFMVKPEYAKRLHPGGGLIRACVIIAGEAVANWKLERRRKSARIVVAPFQALDTAALPLMQAEAERLSRFLGRELALRIEEV